MNIGDQYEAPWGRYVVHRTTSDGIVLRDLSNFTACIIVSATELAGEQFRLVASAAPPAPPSPAPCLAPTMHALGICGCGGNGS